MEIANLKQQIETYKKKIKIMEHALSASAGAYYNINITQNRIPLFVKLDVSKTLFFCCYISSCFDRGYLDQSKLSMTSGSDHRCAIIDSLACSRCWAVKQV